MLYRIFAPEYSITTYRCILVQNQYIAYGKRLRPERNESGLDGFSGFGQVH
jgi:hypothetical protein